jgi:hypothetical protein
MSYPRYLVLAYDPDPYPGKGAYTDHFNQITDAVNKAQDWVREVPIYPEDEKLTVAIFQLVEVVKDKSLP